MPYVHIKSLRTVIHLITWIIFYDRDADKLVIIRPQLNTERLISLIFVGERLKRVVSSKKQFSCRAFLLENFQNFIIGRCGCQATAKSHGFLQKSIKNTTIETNFKYLRQVFTSASVFKRSYGVTWKEKEGTINLL